MVVVGALRVRVSFFLLLISDVGQSEVPAQ